MDQIVGSLTDDEKLRLAELLGEDDEDMTSEHADWIVDVSDDNQSCDESDQPTDSVLAFSSTTNLDHYHYEDHQDGEKEDSDVEEEDEEGEDDDDDDDGIESLDNASRNSVDSENYNPYNTDPELLTRLDQIDDKLKKLNNDYSKTMEDLVRFQEDDFDLKARLKDIDESLKKLSCDNTALFYFDQNTETTDNGSNPEECNPNLEETQNPSDDVLLLNDNENIFNINYSEACDCSENWANVKKKYDLQIHKIEDMLEKLCETNDKNICMKNEEELRERGNRAPEYEID
ncbi:serine/threonine-protein phosphatase 4 regulatory subunit 2 isoform X1 [Nilaparvata lugens]|uniref:serine/threonine-protein phosphatase 4 regulatory subunit 2 isoform X1 n=1 Tax=Nilaparvata lugens TaxID=108931 RepID=UPI00193DDCEF|nr:serine/threonine-protein phosphatase 4 regulatory subunit 2 isoform X1 [Nilaparvata lugens]